MKWTKILIKYNMIKSKSEPALMYTLYKMKKIKSYEQIQYEDDTISISDSLVVSCLSSSYLYDDVFYVK